MRYFLLAGIVMLVCPTLWSQTAVIESKVLMTVSGKPVMADEFIYLYKKNNQGKNEAFTAAKIDEYFTLFTNFKLKIAEAHSRGLDTTRKFREEYKTYREELKRPYRAEPDLLSKLTREAYDRMKEEVRASHILIMVNPDASAKDTAVAYNKIADIKKRIDAAENFFKLAQELSEDPSAKYNGGDLGYFTAMQMVYPFEQGAYALQPGEVSPIIRTRFGYHLIKLVDRKPSRGEVEVAHILFRKTGADDAALKNKAFEVFDQLKAGRNWEELVQEYSDDGNTKNNGGKLRPFGVGALATIPEFESTAFALEKPGDVSDPFQSSVGWHIVRLEKKIPLAPYSEIEASLKRRISKDERVQLSEKKLAEKRKREFGFTEDASVKAQVLAYADSNLLRKQFKYTGPSALISQPLFSVKGKSVKAGEFFKFCEHHNTNSNSTPRSLMEQLYELMIADKLSEVEEELLKSKYPEFKNLVNEYREGILLFEVMEKEVWNKASEDTVGQRKFFELNKSRYQAGPRAEARVLATTDKDFLATMKARLQKGDSLKGDELKKFKSVQNFRKYEKGDSKIVDKAPWEKGIHEVAMDGTWYLVEVKELLPPGLKSFQDARASVISDYQDQLEKEWVTSLVQKFEVKINKKTKKFVVEELTGK